jgi:hypothetical protein
MMNATANAPVRAIGCDLIFSCTAASCIFMCALGAACSEHDTRGYTWHLIWRDIIDLTRLDLLPRAASRGDFHAARETRARSSQLDADIQCTTNNTLDYKSIPH